MLKCSLLAIIAALQNLAAPVNAEEGDCDCGAEPYKDAPACREEHLPDCPAALTTIPEPAGAEAVVKLLEELATYLYGNEGGDGTGSKLVARIKSALVKGN